MTTHTSHPPSIPTPTEHAPEPLPPAWLNDWIGENLDQHAQPRGGGLETFIRRGTRGTLLSVRLADARQSDSRKLGTKTQRAFAALHAALLESSRQHVVRMWNFIPGIHDAMDDGQNRYMSFNAARYAALSHWFGGDTGIARLAPAASGVGHAGSDLTIHALAIDSPGRPLENPQQIPAYRYSTRWGRVPPCFARATLIDTLRPTLLVSGTASVIGEDTVHAGNLAAQRDATCLNLRRILEAAGFSNTDDGADWTRSLSHVRVYVPGGQDLAESAAWASHAFAGVSEIETVPAELCRPELLVEVELLAEQPAEPEGTP